MSLSVSVKVLEEAKAQQGRHGKNTARPNSKDHFEEFWGASKWKPFFFTSVVESLCSGLFWDRFGDPAEKTERRLLTRLFL